MPFALAVTKGEAQLRECLFLTPEEIDDMQGIIIVSDWREGLIEKLKDEVKHVKFSEIASGIGAELKGDSLFIKCLGRDFEISPDGDVITGGRITPWIKILLLHYIRIAGKSPLTGRWISYSEIKDGMVKALSFERDCEDPLKELFDNNLRGAEMALQRLGAEKRDDFPAQNAWSLDLLPKIPVIILYWPHENEFESKIKIIFDSSADRFLDAEAIIFLVEGLVKYIEAALMRP